MSEADRPTRHLAARCPRCNAAFVVITLPAKVEVAVHRMKTAICPDCGTRKGLLIAMNEDHDRAVARLRQEAAQP